MSILIDRVRVRGFRGIQNLELSLPRIAVLIGPNNSGKTTILKAIQLSIGDYARYLSDEDFNIGPKETRAGEIVVELRIISVDDKSGERAKEFEADWQTEFGDKIQAEASGHQFIAIRTRASTNVTKGGFDVTRTSLDAWPTFATWTTAKPKETKINGRMESLPFICMEAQRDIHHDLRDKSSFIGKILAGIEYDKAEIENLENLIKAVNDQAVLKSEDLKLLKLHLEKLNHAIGGKGGAEVTPFPKRIRDLSKNFSVHFGDSPEVTVNPTAS